MNGSASRPSSATMNGTRWAIRPTTKATSRESRSSLATTTLHFAAFAALKAAAVGMLSFESLWWALLPPALYLGIHLRG
jgi:hypothetical protein